MKIIKKLALTSLVIVLICVVYELVFNLDMWNGFFIPLFKGMWNTIIGIFK